MLMSELAPAKEQATGDPVASPSNEMSAPPAGAGAAVPVAAPTPTLLDVTEQVSADAKLETKLGEKGAPSDWTYADGIKGEGAVPEWFKAGKFGSVADQAKAWVDLMNTTGSFTGAPEGGYTHTPTKDLTGVELDKNNSLYRSFEASARKMNMSQEGFNDFINMWLTDEKHVRDQSTESTKKYEMEQLRLLGPEFDLQKKSLNQWCEKSLTPAEHTLFKEMGTSAANIKLLMKLVEGNKITPIPTQNAQPSDDVLPPYKIKELQADTRYNGSNPSFCKTVDAEAVKTYTDPRYKDG